MTKTSRSVTVAFSHNKAPLSKGQRAFNSAIRQIEKRRERLRSWELVTPVFQQQYVNELLPLQQTATTLEIRMVHCLDEAYARLTKAERQKVALVIVDLAGDLIGEDDGESKELKAIHDKYSPTSYDSQVAAEVDGMRSMFEAVFGVDLGTILTRTPQTTCCSVPTPTCVKPSWNGMPGARSGKIIPTTGRRSPCTGAAGKNQSVDSRDLPKACQRTAPGPRN